MPVGRAAIKRAIEERAEYIKDHVETLTPRLVRRLLEEDLGLAKNEIDSEKVHIKFLLETILNEDIGHVVPSEDVEVAASDSTKQQEGTRSHETSGTNDEFEPEIPPKRRKRVEEEDLKDKVPKEGKAPATEPYGREVERLKGLIQACGMRVPPVVYKKANQAPNGKKELALISELEGLLAKKGLSTNPTEQDVKRMKKKLEKERELEGIDTGNIILETRGRRQTAVVKDVSYVQYFNKSDSDGSSDDEDDEVDESDSEVEAVSDDDDDDHS